MEGGRVGRMKFVVRRLQFNGVGAGRGKYDDEQGLRGTLPGRSRHEPYRGIANAATTLCICASVHARTRPPEASIPPQAVAVSLAAEARQEPGGAQRHEVYIAKTLAALVRRGGEAYPSTKRDYVVSLSFAVRDNFLKLPS